MLIFRVFTDAGVGGGFANRRFRAEALNHTVIHFAVLSRASHDWRMSSRHL